jgi:hypothetical protein
MKQIDVELRKKCKRNAMHQNEIRKQQNYEGPVREVPCTDCKQIELMEG